MTRESPRKAQSLAADSARELDLQAQLGPKSVKAVLAPCETGGRKSSFFMEREQESEILVH